MNQQTRGNVRNDEKESDLERNLDKAKNMVREKTAPIKEKAGEVAEEAKSVMEQAGHQAKSTVAVQKEQAASQLHGVAQALRQTSDRLRDQDQRAFASYSNQAADQIDRMSSYLQERDVNELMRDAKDFARRQPELFLGGAFTLGLLAARFLKSSAPDIPEPSPYSESWSTAVPASPIYERTGGEMGERPYSSTG